MFVLIQKGHWKNRLMPKITVFLLILLWSPVSWAVLPPLYQAMQNNDADALSRKALHITETSLDTGHYQDEKYILMYSALENLMKTSKAKNPHREAGSW